MDEELRADLLDRAGRDQAARMSLRPGHGLADWEAVVAPVDRDNTVRLREIVGRHGWPGHRLVGPLELWPVRNPAGLDQRRAALGLAPEAENRARLVAGG